MSTYVVTMANPKSFKTKSAAVKLAKRIADLTYAPVKVSTKNPKKSNPKKAKRKSNPQLLGWNRTQDNRTRGYFLRPPGADNSGWRPGLPPPTARGIDPWWTITKVNIGYGGFYFTVERDGQFLGQKGSMFFAKQLAEQDAAHLALSSVRSNPRSVKVPSRTTLEKRHAKLIAAGRYDEASRVFSAYAHAVGAHAPNRGPSGSAVSEAKRLVKRNPSGDTFGSGWHTYQIERSPVSPKKWNVWRTSAGSQELMGSRATERGAITLAKHLATGTGSAKKKNPTWPPGAWGANQNWLIKEAGKEYQLQLKKHIKAGRSRSTMRYIVPEWHQDFVNALGLDDPSEFYALKHRYLTGAR